MVEDEQSSKNVLNRAAKISLIVLVPIILLLGVAWHILRSDHAFVIRKVQETALEYWDVKLQLDGYRLEWTTPYPLIRFQVRGLSIASVHRPQQPVLRVNKATSEFNPWDLVTGNFQAHPFQLDSAWVHVYLDTLEFERQAAEKLKDDDVGALNLDVASMPAITVNYLDFHREDDYRYKWQRVKFSELRMEPRTDESGDWWMQLHSDCFFDGLVFKHGDGGFLTETPAELDMHLNISDNGRTLKWEKSTLQVGRNSFALRGQYYWADTNQIQLQISTDGIMLSDALPLLSNKLNQTLCAIQSDQPIRTDFSLYNLTIPGRKEAIEVEFLTRDATLQYQETILTSASISGTFSNDCDQDGLGDPVTSCITLHQVDGDFFGVLPAQIQALINNMVEPHVEASGRMEIDMPRLNPLLTEKDKATFANGRAIVNFEYDGPLINMVASPFDNRDTRVTGDAVFHDITLATADLSLTSPSLSGYLTFNERQTLLEDIDLEWMGAKIQLSGQIRNLPEFFFYDDQTLISNLGLHFDRLDLNQFKPATPSEKSPKKDQSPDARRLEAFARQLANNVNGQMQLKIDRLIYDTLFLTDLSTRFRLYTLRREDYADSSMIRMDSLRANFMGTTPIYANLKVSRDAVPEVAFDVNVPSAVRPANQFLPKNLGISAGRARMQFSAWMPLRAVLQDQGIPTGLRYQGRLDLDGINFTDRELSRLVRDVTGPLIFETEQLTFDHLQFAYDDSPFTLNGQVVDLAFFDKSGEKKATMDLQLDGKALDLRPRSGSGDAKAVPAQKTFSPPEVFRSLGKLFPYVTGALELQVDEVFTKKQTITPLHLEASLQPDADRDGRHQLQIDSFQLGFGSGNYFKGNALIRDPDRPNITAQLYARLNFTRLGQLLPSEYLEMKSGEFLMDLEYQSPLHDTLNAQNYLLDANVDGNARLVNGELFYNYRDFSFKNISGRFHFDQQALYIQNLDLEVNGNRLTANGKSDQFFSFFVLPDQRANIVLDVHSSRFDFNSFTAPHGLGKDTLRTPRKANKTAKRQSAGTTAPDTTTVLKQTVGYVDQLLDRGTIEMSTDFTEVVYDDFTARQVNGRISLAPDTVQLQNLQMDVADGTFALGGQISNIVKHEPKMEVTIQLDQNNVREIFRQFDNFGQRDILYKNLEGLISAELLLKADANSNYTILPETMYGDMKVKLAGGELVDLKLFEKLSGFLFRNRGMDHVILDTLELDAHIRGSDLYVDNFYLHSSPFDFQAMGRYSLGSEKSTRVLFKLPIGNLFNRHVSLKEMEDGHSKRFRLINILIEARYKNDKMRFIWKPFVFSTKKYRLEE